MTNPTLARTSTLAALCAAALATSAQTAKPTTPAAKPAVRRSTTTTAHRPATSATTCSVETPALSPKIPVLAKSNGCPKSLYTLAYIDTEIGTGEVAVPRKYYTVHYTGYLPDGTKFDSSFDHPGAEPITFPYVRARLSPAGTQDLKACASAANVGCSSPTNSLTAKRVVPPIIPAKAQLIFDVQLVAMSDKPPAPKTPAPAPAQPSGTAPGTTAPVAKPSTDAEPPATTKPATPPPTQSTTPDASAKPAAPKQ